MRIRIAMSLMSVIFMLAVAILFNISNLVPGNSEYALAELMSIISLIGSMLFLLEARKVLPRWYLAIPFCISLFLIAIVCFWQVSGEEFLSGYLYIVTSVVIILLALLSLFSVLVFLSLHMHPYPMTAYLAVSSIASIISMFSLFFALWEILFRYSQGAHYSLGLEVLCFSYWLVVMPILGLCFLVRAIK